MLEHLLSISRPAANDNSDLPFPSGTPFKGVVSASNFITGDALATAVGFTQGITLNNSSAGWLHFIEDTGLELYIAKKPLRCNITWEQLNNANLITGKDIDIGGVTYVCRVMKGALVSGGSHDDSNGGGEWNRYMYNVSGGVGRPSFPANTPVWGNYSDIMLGIGLSRYGAFDDGAFNICRESVAGGHIARGMVWNSSSLPNIMGVWYVQPNSTHSGFSWRPMLVKKSSIPEVITPYKGIVNGADLITGADLSAALGLSSTGTVFGDGNPGWLHYIDNGKEFYIAKKPLRTSVLWETLNAQGAVTGTKQITIGGKQYKVRLMTGGDTSPVTTRGGEYDAYFARTTDMYDGQVDDRYAELTAADVGWIAGTGNGALQLCQAYYASNGPLTRGYPDFYGVWYQAPGATHGGYSWRPVLELIP